ncbi:MAG: hypothetical protein E7256_04320 [Lachnospiraceae bacterium]|nr:hypothetical protein [Lachnospiraceae bacterium]
MNYIWFNPVVIAMYGEYQLHEFAEKNQFIPAKCLGDWETHVKKRYQETLSVADKPVVDMRCPKAVDYIREHFPNQEYTFPDIDPILVHCAKELRESFSEEHSLTVVTPCAELASYGENLGLTNTRFIAFNTLLSETGDTMQVTTIESSPIPPGFFTDVTDQALSLTGEETIHSFFANKTEDSHKLYELLYCHEGCHNGKGVR